MLKSPVTLTWFLKSKGLSEDVASPEVFLSIAKNLYFYYLDEGKKVGHLPQSAWIELNKERGTNWLKDTYFRGLSIRDLKEHGMLPSIDAEGYLSLTDLNLGSLEGLAEVPNIDQVRQLGLERNNLRRLGAGAFEGLENLSVLWMGGNRLVMVDEDAFRGLKNLKSIIGAREDYMDTRVVSSIIQAAQKVNPSVLIR